MKTFHKRFLIEVALLLVVSMLFFTRAHAFGLKGVEVDSPYDEAQVVAAFGQPYTPVEIAGVITEVKVTEFRGKVLVIDCTFPSYNFAHMRELLTTKYGKPKTTVTMGAMNALGARMPLTVVTWKDYSGNVMELISSFDVAHGSLTIKSAEQVASEPKDSGI